VPIGALGFGRAPETKTCSAFFEADQVFVGTVTNAEGVKADGSRPEPDDTIETLRFTIRVSQVLKGQARPVEVVQCENSSGRWLAQVGETRVVFVRNGYVGIWSDPVDRPSRVQRTLHELHSLSRKDASVEGDVVNARTLAGHDIAVIGEHARYTARTDSRGRFHVTVAPGHYRLEAPGFFPFTPYSREDIDGFTVVAGECAQFELSAKDPKGPITPISAPQR